jgi:hypothetical protein
MLLHLLTQRTRVNITSSNTTQYTHELQQLIARHADVRRQQRSKTPQQQARCL